jgi:HlyD family secretion protein
MTATTAATPTSPPLQRTVPNAPSRRRSRRARRWIKRGLLVGGALAAIGAVVYAWLPKPVPVDVATVQRGSLDVTVTEDGHTRVRDRFIVSAPITGNLIRIELEPGARVEAGAVVAQLGPPDPVALDDRTRAETRARLAAAIAQEKQARAAIARARTSLSTITREAARTRELARRGAVTVSERERQDDAEQLARTDLAQAELGRAAAAAEVTAARAALGGGGPTSSGTIAIKAPVGGTVLRVIRDSAGPVASGTPLLEVGDLQAIEAVIDVLSSDAARIAVGTAATIEDWGGERALAGRVRAIEPSAFTRISALGIEEQRVNVIIAIDDPPPALGDGFRVEARISIWHGANVLTIPSSAVFRDQRQWAVYVVTEGRADRRSIDLGHRGQTKVEVLSGLEEGAIVIVHPGDRIADGVRVAPR